YEESLALHQHLEERGGIAGTLYALGNLAALQQDYASAHSLYTQSLTLSHELGVLPGVVDSLERLAGLAATRGQARRAAQLFCAAGNLRATMDTPRPPSSEETDHERIQTAARAALGEEAFAAAWAEGCAMTQEQAIKYAGQEGKSG